MLVKCPKCKGYVMPEGFLCPECGKIILEECDQCGRIEPAGRSICENRLRQAEEKRADFISGITVDPGNINWFLVGTWVIICIFLMPLTVWFDVSGRAYVSEVINFFGRLLNRLSLIAGEDYARAWGAIILVILEIAFLYGILRFVRRWLIKRLADYVWAEKSFRKTYPEEAEILEKASSCQT